MKALWSELLSTVSQHLQWIRACELHRPSPHTSRPRQNRLMCRRVNCQICSAAGEYKIILLVLPYCVKSAESNLFSPLSHYLEHKTLLITWIRRVGWSWYLSFSTTKITFSLSLLSFRQKHLERLQKSAVKDSLELLVCANSWVKGDKIRGKRLEYVIKRLLTSPWSSFYRLSGIADVLTSAPTVKEPLKHQRMRLSYSYRNRKRSYRFLRGSRKERI